MEESKHCRAGLLSATRLLFWVFMLTVPVGFAQATALYDSLAQWTLTVQSISGGDQALFCPSGKACFYTSLSSGGTEGATGDYSLFTDPELVPYNSVELELGEGEQLIVATTASGLANPGDTIISNLDAYLSLSLINSSSTDSLTVSIELQSFLSVISAVSGFGEEARARAHADYSFPGTSENFSIRNGAQSSVEELIVETDSVTNTVLFSLVVDPFDSASLSLAFDADGYASAAPAQVPAPMSLYLIALGWGLLLTTRDGSRRRKTV